MQGTTKSGYQFNIDNRILKDWRFVSALSSAQKGSSEFEKLGAVVEMTKLLFGDTYEAYLEYIASKNNGYCDADVIMEEIKEIFESAAIKN